MGPVALNDSPARRKIVERQSQLGREHIHRPEWEQPERNIVAGNAVHDLVDRAVAPRGHDFFVTFLRRISGERFGLADPTSRAQN